MPQETWSGKFLVSTSGLLLLFQKECVLFEDVHKYLMF